MVDNPDDIPFRPLLGCPPGDFEVRLFFDGGGTSGSRFSTRGSGVCAVCRVEENKGVGDTGACLRLRDTGRADWPIRDL